MEGTWSSGMILASGARGREFDSPSAPYPSVRFFLSSPQFYRKSGIRFIICVAEFHWERRLGIGILCGGGALGTPIQLGLLGGNFNN